MTELANTNREISTIDQLAMQAQTLRLSINLNMWQLAKVFIEAKEIVPHGEWGQWLRDNADVSERTAQDMMAAYKRFGGVPRLEGIGQARTFKLLPLPAGTEEQFLEAHDVANMSTRQIQEAVKAERDKWKAQLEESERARADAEKRASDAAARAPEVPEEVAEELRRNREKIADQQSEIERLASTTQTSMDAYRELAQENSNLQRELTEKNEILAEQQDDINRAQQELLNVRSAIAKGDAERVPADQLTLDAFASAVRAFVGTCARMPQMGIVFAGMGLSERDEYSILLATVEKWAEDSRKALNTSTMDGTVI